MFSDRRLFHSMLLYPETPGEQVSDLSTVGKYLGSFQSHFNPKTSIAIQERQPQLG